MTAKPVPYSFGLFDCLLAQNAGLSNYSLHTDVDAVIRAADAALPLCRRLGIDPVSPHLYGMSYLHVSTLGVPVINGPQYMEPGTLPSIHHADEIDTLREPEDYLACGLFPQRIALMKALAEVRPDASCRLGHPFEGPVTTAVLMMGESFFMLALDDPGRAHRLLKFVTVSAINCCKAMRRFDGQDELGGRVGIPDDFAGMFAPEQFKEFVVPYWAMLYEELGATRRDLHSELLRPDHLPMLKDLKIDSFDPSVDPFLPPETLAQRCPVPYGDRIWPSTVRSSSTEKLLALYRRLASFNPQYVMFHLEHVDDEAKIAALLKLARELAGEDR